MDTWALFSKKKNEHWVFNGFTSYEELAAEFTDEVEEEEEIRVSVCLEDGINNKKEELSF